MNNFYVYCYKDPITLLPFYIGKGSKDRATFHLKLISSNLHKNKYFSNTVKKLRSEGLEPIIEIIENNLQEVDAYSLESLLIEQYGRKLYDENGILCNLTKGGIGPVGYKHSIDDKAKMKTNFNNSPEANNNRRLSKLGKKHDQETKDKMANSKRGVPKSLIHIEHMKKPKTYKDKEAFCKSRSKSLQDNQNRALSWKVTSPTGEIFIVENLSIFCRERGFKTFLKEIPSIKGIAKGWSAVKLKIIN